MKQFLVALIAIVFGAGWVIAEYLVPPTHTMHLLIGAGFVAFGLYLLDSSPFVAFVNTIVVPNVPGLRAGRRATDPIVAPPSDPPANGGAG